MEILLLHNWNKSKSDQDIPIIRSPFAFTNDFPWNLLTLKTSQQTIWNLTLPFNKTYYSYTVLVTSERQKLAAPRTDLVPDPR